MTDKDFIYWLYCYTTYQENDLKMPDITKQEIVRELPRLLDAKLVTSASSLRNWRLTESGYKFLDIEPLTEMDILDNYHEYTTQEIEEN